MLTISRKTNIIKTTTKLLDKFVTSLHSNVLGLSLESLADCLGGNIRVLDVVETGNSPEGRHDEDVFCNIKQVKN